MRRRNHDAPGRLTWLWLLLLLLAAPATARAEVVVLHFLNGDRITGELISEASGQIVIQTSTLGRLTIPEVQVARREKLTPPPPPKPIAPTNAAAAKPATTNKVAQVPAPKPPAPKRWFFEAQLGANMQFNQQDTEVFYAHQQTRYDRTPFRGLFDIKANHGTLNDVLSANNMDGLLRGEFDVSKRVFFFNAMTAGYDELRKIDFRYDNSLGIGYKLIMRPNLTLNTDLGVNYQKQFFSDGERPGNISMRFGEVMSWKMTKRISLDHRAEFMPRNFSTDNFQVRLEANLSYLLTDHLTFNVSVSDLYDARPPRGITPNDLQIRSSIGVRF
jgi:hypothetical protein